ncbi:sensor histidine kinase [Kingella negevensis]|uniref:histidine kinase n=1 Tax=Kingella negevensis TaxID=1522312 RepID=A0A238TAZ6_9NEIS|nr:HAMP domain-containing sensor histidine kinase [Kingella negevensis]MDK4680698.1 HAMP domain-containing sensor histidine kinase [Kingella negevensis]MDK4681578.1 HAMP domain-containing sensor histidine kinase [Kingella negevensis]MDK4683662.1 HAMP domain-containing sensor histidine kinase [Kingella negevensis]MDK4687768.1 HAMP domain-containing sensor histidine kinase [Kingella negevensis]MDK4691966.1 HAMP domain-containing sensor histidine kinase [Kingella negevensis]
MKKTKQQSASESWHEQSTRLVNLLNIARVSILFSMMVLIVIIHNLRDLPIPHITSTYTPLVENAFALEIWCAAYGFLIVMSAIRPMWQIQENRDIPNVSSVIDITFMVALTAIAGGVSSGFGILILPFLATACILSYGKFPITYGSYAVLLVMSEAIWRLYPFNDLADRDNLSMLTGQGLLMIACFIVPTLTSIWAKYLFSADDSLQFHRSAYARLSDLNKLVLNRVQEAVIVLDKGGQIWLHNRQATRYFPDIKSGTEAKFLQPLVKRWQAKPKTTYETNLEINEVLMHVRAVPVIRENTELLTLFIRSDKELQIEAQTVKLTSLGLLTANLAHEIRNPLSAMRQSNGLLLEMGQEEDNLMIERLSGIIEKNIARIDKMIEDVSALNKSDRLNPEPIHLMKFWMGFVQEFQLTRPEAKGCLKIDMAGERIDVIFDPMHLQQIIWNLCNNAWRHSQQQKDSVVVSVRLMGTQTVSIRVWDDGPGVAPEMQEHLFEPFNTNQATGTGLGLYVARELAHANRGDLSYLPQVKSFELILPRKTK